MELNLCYHPLDVLKACRSAAENKTFVTMVEDFPLLNMGNMDDYIEWTGMDPSKFAVERAAFFSLLRWVVIAMSDLPGGTFQT